MILMRQRCPEEGHDAVAHDLIHRALKAVHRLHHAFEHGIEDLPRLLGVTVREELHRALEVGEEDCHMLALAFERGPGEDDAFGKMFRRVSLWGSEARRGGRVVCQLCRVSALGTELRYRGKMTAAIRTCPGQR